MMLGCTQSLVTTSLILRLGTSVDVVHNTQHGRRIISLNLLKFLGHVLLWSHAQGKNVWCISNRGSKTMKSWRVLNLCALMGDAVIPSFTMINVVNLRMSKLSCYLEFRVNCTVGRKR